MAMARTNLGRNSGFGPFGGEYYDESEENGTLGVAVLWTGKTAETEYSDSSGITKLVFTDGSWADLYYRTCSNAGPGALALCDFNGNVLAK